MRLDVSSFPAVFGLDMHQVRELTPDRDHTFLVSNAIGSSNFPYSD